MTVNEILTFIRFITDSDADSYTNANFLIALNNAYRNIVSRILRGDRTWEFDDLNYNTFPIFLEDLTAARNDYALDNSFLNILKVHVRNSNGDFEELAPLDISSLTVPVDELFETNGMPQYYDLRYGSVWLYPAPATGDVTLADGLRIYAQRGADEFTSAQVTTGTKEPGFAINHEVLAYMAAIPFAQAYRKDRVAGFEVKAKELANEILEHYAGREKGTRKVMKFTGINPV